MRGDDWHALRREDWMGVSSLVLFMNSLEFCNAVVQVTHPLVRSQLLDYLHNGFLVPVMGPALHKVRKERGGGIGQLVCPLGLRCCIIGYINNNSCVCLLLTMTLPCVEQFWCVVPPGGPVGWG